METLANRYNLSKKDLIDLIEVKESVIRELTNHLHGVNRPNNTIKLIKGD